MGSQEFEVETKLVGVIVDKRTGEVIGQVDGTGLLPKPVAEVLSARMGEAFGQAMLQEARNDLEHMFELPARDIESERAETG